MARVASRVAQIQQDNLLDVQNFVAPDGIRVMEMEWIDGYDLRRLLTPGHPRQGPGEGRPRALGLPQRRDRDGRGRSSPGSSRASPSPCLRECLAALSALHREGIVHGDIKPSNIMLKRTGNAKLVDIGSAFLVDDPPEHPDLHPELRRARRCSTGSTAPARSDLASLGYALVEMLSGAPLFAGLTRIDELKRAKREILDRLPSMTLPERGRPQRAADGPDHRPDRPRPRPPLPRRPGRRPRKSCGAASFQRQLIRGNLASEYDNEIRVWLEELVDDDDPGSSGEAIAPAVPGALSTNIRPDPPGTTATVP